MRTTRRAIGHEIDILEPNNLALTKERKRLRGASEAVDRILDFRDIRSTPIDDLLREIIHQVLCLFYKPCPTLFRNKVIVVPADKCKWLRWHEKAKSRRALERAQDGMHEAAT